MCFNTVNGKHCCNDRRAESSEMFEEGFNTVNGKYCCNNAAAFDVADLSLMSFNTVNGKYCCNSLDSTTVSFLYCFNTVNGRYCCNLVMLLSDHKDATAFQYRKR